MLLHQVMDGFSQLRNYEDKRALHNMEEYISRMFLGRALLDLMQRCDEPPPSPGKRVLCRHPFDEAKRAYVCPSHVEPLYHIYWKDGKVCKARSTPCTCVNPSPTESKIGSSIKGEVSRGFGIISKVQKCFWTNRNSKIMV